MKNFRRLLSILMTTGLFLGLYIIFNYLNSSYEHILNDKVFLIPENSIQKSFSYCEDTCRSVDKITDANNVDIIFKTPLEKEVFSFPTAILLTHFDTKKIDITISGRFIGSFNGGATPLSYIKIPIAQTDLAKETIEITIRSKQKFATETMINFDLFLGKTDNLTNLYFDNERRNFTKPLMQIMLFTSFVFVFLLLQLLVRKEGLYWNILIISFLSLLSVVIPSNLSFLVFPDSSKLILYFLSRSLISFMVVIVFLKICKISISLKKAFTFLSMASVFAILCGHFTGAEVIAPKLSHLLLGLLIIAGPLSALFLCLRRLSAYNTANKGGKYLKLICLYLFSLNLYVIYICFTIKYHQLAVFDSLLLILLTINSALEFGSNEKTIEKQNEKLIDAARDIAIGETAKSLAHDIRKPFGQLTSILENIESYSSNPTLLKKVKEELVLSVEHSDTMINSLLDFSNESELTLREESLKSCIKNALHLNRKEIQTHNVQVVFEANHTNLVLCNKNKIERVIANLISNAIEAQYVMSNTQDKYIKVSTNLENEKVILSVTNNGPVIAKEEIENLFHSFYSKGKPGGTGLGLSSCKKVLEQHNESIWCSVDYANEEVTFSFSLKSTNLKDKTPLIWQEPNEAVNDSNQSELYGLGKKKVTIFSCNDDLLTNINTQETIKKTVDLYFPDLNVEICTSTSAEELLETIYTDSPSITLCDYILNKSGGKLNGIEALNKIKERDIHSNCYLVTNYSFDEEIEHEYIKAPLNVELTKKIISAHLSFLEKRIHS
jgi:signal transduction histidine kinase